jgi:hypothetical protein
MNDGKYHVPGSLITTPLLIAKKFCKAVMLLRSALQKPGLSWLGPPPYVSRRCCLNQDHLENYNSSEYKQEHLNGIESINRLLNVWARDLGLNYTVNPALLTSSFVWQIQLAIIQISLFKVIRRKYFSQGKFEFLLFLFVLLYKIKILTLLTVYLRHQSLHMLFLTPFRNFWAISRPNLEKWLNKWKVFLMLNLIT